MYEIPQVDSLLEASLSDPRQQIKKLYEENFQLQEEVLKMSVKVDQALESCPKPRTSSEPQRNVRRDSRRASHTPIKSTQHLLKFIFGNPLLKTMESKVSNLEQENLRLKSKLEKNYYFGLDKQVQPLFERHGKFLKLIFKTECVLGKMTREIEVNKERIKDLVEEVRVLESNTRNFTKTASFPRHSSPDLKIQRMYEKEKKLVEELSLFKETFKSKEKQLASLCDLQQNYNQEIQNLEKHKSAEKLPFRQVFSPSNIKRVSNEETGIFPGIRNCKKRFSAGMKNLVGFDKTGRFSGSSEPINRQTSEKLLKTRTEKDLLLSKRVTKIFKNVNLKPEEFEFTHNFSKAIASLKK